MFCARKDKWWAGWDAASLEACMEGHWVFPYDKEYVEELMDGDVHTKNLHLIPALRDRDHSKTFKYGITYGAQPAKVASILGCSKSEGQMYYDMFWDGNRGLKQLKDTLNAQASGNRGFIRTVDGRLIKTRSKHSQLNALFQSSGAIVMKYAMVFADKLIRERFGLEPYGLIRYHDEEIWECPTQEMAEEVGKLGVQSIIAAGRYLKLNVPLNGEYKVGKNWADVH
jgi:DNA polymerase I-like protein with 3'-5' exonuclease and polymerase domains